MSAEEAQRADPRRELERRLLGLRGEAWTRVALVVLALFAAMLLYLGLRPGGRWPIRVYVFGPFWISSAALVVLVWGLVHSLRRRPFVRPERMRALAALVLVVGVASYPIPFPSSHEGRPSLVAFHLPIDAALPPGEAWTVVWGGDSAQTSRLSMLYPDRRYGLDLLVTDAEGRTRRGESDGPEDHRVWDQPVLAPAAGRVVAALDGEPDLAAGARAGGEPLGNHLVIEVAPEQYLFLCHLRRGSLLVGPGDAIERGQEVARVGSSGHSPVTPEPHLALHLQDTPEPRWGQAIPWRFRDYVADGERIERGFPTGGIDATGRFVGQRVRPVGH